MLKPVMSALRRYTMIDMIPKIVKAILSQSIAGALSFDYEPYMMIGMMAIMLFMTVSMGMLTLVDESTADFMQKIMGSPISRYSIVIGKIIGTSFGSILCSLGTLIEDRYEINSTAFFACVLQELS